MKPIELHPEAEDELDEAADHYDAKRKGLGSELIDHVEDVLALIRGNPHIGALYRRTRIRYFVVRRFRYVVYYQIKRDRIRIVAIAHGSQRQGYWWKRLRS